MEKTMITRIMEDAAKMEAANDLMTEALIALEAQDYLEAYEKAEDVLDISDNCEKRLAALYVQELAVREDGRIAQRILEIAYDTDRRDDIIERNNAAHAELHKTVNDFVASLQRIRAKII